MKSKETFDIQGRGIVKVIEAKDLDKTYNVGDDIEIDDIEWVLTGVEMLSPPRREHVGLIVRRKYFSLGDICPTCRKATPCEHIHSDYVHTRCGTSPCSCDPDDGIVD